MYHAWTLKPWSMPHASGVCKYNRRLWSSKSLFRFKAFVFLGAGKTQCNCWCIFLVLCMCFVAPSAHFAKDLSANALLLARLNILCCVLCGLLLCVFVFQISVKEINFWRRYGRAEIKLRREWFWNGRYVKSATTTTLHFQWGVCLYTFLASSL